MQHLFDLLFVFSPSFSGFHCSVLFPPRLFLCLQFFPVVWEEVGSAEPGVPPLCCLPGCLFIALLSLICRDARVLQLCVGDWILQCLLPDKIQVSQWDFCLLRSVDENKSSLKFFLLSSRTLLFHPVGSIFSEANAVLLLCKSRH